MASLKALREWIGKSKSRAQAIARGEGTTGQRAAPSRITTNDEKIGSRLYSGDIFWKNKKKLKHFKWQLNKNADNFTLKKLAAKNCHKIWSHADVEIDENANEKQAKAVFDELFSQLERNMEDE